MKGKRLSAILMSLVLTGSLCACGGKSSLKDYKGLPEIRFASFYGMEEGKDCKLKMRVPFDDSFNVKFSSNSVKNVTIMNEEGKQLASSEEPFDIELKENQLVYVKIVPAQSKIKVDITAKEHASQLPFDIEGAPDVSKYSTASVSGDPLEPAEIAAKKRDHGLYIYSNSPEAILPECINTALTRHDVSNEEVFFTFEHNSVQLRDSGFYYGYQVLNTGTTDAYITVKNIGLQLGGGGTYYGESEWTSFYNTKFELPFKINELTVGEKKSFDAWYSFTGNALNPKFQPVTYRVPAGKYIYVLGGTTDDAYNNYNVAGTANKRVGQSCENGAVLFDVVGQAEAMFYVYDDAKKIGPDNKTHQGLSTKDNRTSNGWDTGAVVDLSAVWTFNDSTPSQDLPVTFTNYYIERELDEKGQPIEPRGEAFTKIPTTPHTKTLTTWYTHSNVNNYPDSLGTDMTAFHTTYEGKDAVISSEYYDAQGRQANIGNWMKDYIDTYTFVNQGDSKRELTVMIKPVNCGGLTVLARDEQGKIIPDSARFSLFYSPFEDGAWLNYEYYYTFEVAPHSVRQISFEYNLMANSYGTVSHTVTLA